MRGKLTVTVEVFDGIEQRSVIVQGRDAWALQELVDAGAKGCTPIDRPGPRWSGYVHKLKRKYGIHIESIPERHGGQFAGRHVRYVLRSNLRIISISGQVAA